MNIEKILDKLVSNIIIYFSYVLITVIWYYLYSTFKSDNSFLILYLPYSIIVLGFLFFGKKIILGLALSQISIYFILESYNLELPFNNYVTLSLCQLMSVPITLIIFQKINWKVGTGKNYKFDKTNIFHVLLIIFYSTVVLGTLFIFSSLFYYNETNLLTFAIGNFFGAVTSLISVKIFINIPKTLKILFRSD